MGILKCMYNDLFVHPTLQNRQKNFLTSMVLRLSFLIQRGFLLLVFKGVLEGVLGLLEFGGV